MKVTLMMFVTLFSCLHSTDPDFLVGFEVATLSWGYLVDRAATLDINLAKELSRIPSVLFVCNSVRVVSFHTHSILVLFHTMVLFHSTHILFHFIWFCSMLPTPVPFRSADFPGVKQHSASSFTLLVLFHCRLSWCEAALCFKFHSPCSVSLQTFLV